MKTKMTKGIIIVLFIASMLIAVNAIPTQACQAGDATLIAGGGNEKSAIVVGTVHVWICDDYLKVKYDLTDGWLLAETHLHVADSWEEIPQKNGNPIPGKFDYKMEHDGVSEFTYSIPLADLGDVDCVFIAAHAVVYNSCGCDCYMEETAWADGDCHVEGFDFPGRNWATGFKYCLGC